MAYAYDFEPDALKQAQGSKLDDPQFGSMAASQRREATRYTLNAKTAEIKAKERIVRRGYRNFMRAGRADKALELMNAASVQNLQVTGIRQAGSTERRALAELQKQSRTSQHDAGETQPTSPGAPGMGTGTGSGGSSSGSSTGDRKDYLENLERNRALFYSTLKPWEKNLFQGRLKTMRDNSETGDITPEQRAQLLEELEETARPRMADAAKKKRNLEEQRGAVRNRERDTQQRLRDLGSNDGSFGGLADKRFMEGAQRRIDEFEASQESPYASFTGEAFERARTGSTVSDSTRRASVGEGIKGQEWQSFKDQMDKDVFNGRISSDQAAQYAADLSNVVKNYQNYERAAMKMYGAKGATLLKNMPKMPKGKDFANPKLRMQWISDFLEWENKEGVKVGLNKGSNAYKAGTILAKQQLNKSKRAVAKKKAAEAAKEDKKISKAAKEARKALAAAARNRELLAIAEEKAAKQ